MIYSQIMYIKYKVRVFDINSEFALSGSPPQPYIDFGIWTESISDFHDILINQLQRIIIDQGILSADKAIVKHWFPGQGVRFRYARTSFSRFFTVSMHHIDPFGLIPPPVLHYWALTETAARL